MGADAGRSAVHRGHDRLLAIEHRGDQPLGAIADESGDLSLSALRCALGAGRSLLAGAQVGAGAEGVADGGEHHRSHRELLAGVAEQVDHTIALVR